MSLSTGELRELVCEKDFKTVLEDGNLKRTSSKLISLLYEDDFTIFRAGEALGIVISNFDNTEQDFVRKILNKLFWHLNDESGAYCRGAPVGIGEIGRTSPFTFEGFRNKTVSLLDDWEVEHKFVIYAIGRAAKNIKNAYPDPLEKLIPFLDHENEEVRGYTVWALGELRDLRAKKPLQKMKEGISEKIKVKLYVEEFREVFLVEFVEEILNKLPNNVTMG